MNKNEDILKRAIEKANDNGFVTPVWHIGGMSSLVIIFSHDFARAFWGDEKINSGIPRHSVCVHILPAWQHHLRELVLCKNPFKYIAKFI